MVDRLYRSRTERVIGGVAGGMAAALGIDVGWVRFGWVVFALVTQGAAILVYFVLLFVIPEEPPRVTSIGGEANPAGQLPGDPSSSHAPRPPVAGGPAVRQPSHVPLVVAAVVRRQ